MASAKPHALVQHIPSRAQTGNHRGKEESWEKVPLGEPCDHLDAAVKKKWRSILPRLIPGIATEADREHFGIMCTLFCEFDESPRDFAVAKISQLRQYSGMFGMSPGDRVKFMTRKDKNKGNEFDDF
jgi:phage terminase small subunit